MQFRASVDAERNKYLLTFHQLQLATCNTPRARSSLSTMRHKAQRVSRIAHTLSEQKEGAEEELLVSN